MPKNLQKPRVWLVVDNDDEGKQRLIVAPTEVQALRRVTEPRFQIRAVDALEAAHVMAKGVAVEYPAEPAAA